MKKLLVIFFIVLSIMVIGTYTLLFTPTGNGVVASFIEDSVNDGGKVDFKVKNFVLTMKRIDFLATVDDNSQIKVEGGLDILSQITDLTYDISVKDLSKLQKITEQKLNGSFSTSGSVKGNSNLMVIKGISDVGNSETTYNVDLVELEPSDITFMIKGAKIEKLLYLVNQPIYAKGLIDISSKLKDLSGDIVTKISNGMLQNKIVNEKFTMKLKKAFSFKGDIVTSLTKDQAVSKVDFFTSMANVFVKKAVVNLKNGVITSDYSIQVNKLSKLFDVTQTKLRGAVTINGDIKKDDDLLVTGVSKLLGGALNYKLLNDDFSATIKDVIVQKALYMLYYPEFFTSKTNLKVDYNLASQKGELTGQLLNGQFLESQFSSILNTFAQFDITKEVYEFVNIKSDINKNIIESTVDMKSKYTSISVPSSKIDTQKRTVLALVKTDLKGIEFDTNISGTFDNPKIKVDTSKLISSGAKEKAKEKINKAIEKKLGENADGFLKGLFK